MDIVSTFNPPRLVILNGRDFWIRGLTIEDFSLVIAWLDDSLPNRDDRTLPPKFVSDEAQAMMETPLGWCVLSWAAMRHVPGASWDWTCRLILNTFKTDYSDGALERSRLLSVLFRRRKTLKISDNADDIGQAWWGPMVESLCTNLGYTIADIAGMTLDQLDCLGRKGAIEEKVGVISIEDVQAMWEAAMTVEAV